MKRFKRLSARWGLFFGLLALSFYTLHGDNSVPDLALQSVKLLKKSIEDLLPDLQKPAEEEQENVQAIQETTLDLEPYQDLHNDRERWNEMRHLIEAGQPLFTPLPSEVAISTSPRGRLAPAIPPPPGFTVSLPYESRLTVSGRKTIGFVYQNSGYSNSTYAANQGLQSSQSNFTLQQQLQVRINGQIGRKVTVNVDFDDTKTDKQDISIVYKGDPDEIVQRAAFGDITLSLPQTEFAGYSKQVFGASAELKYKALRGFFIGSRTKGTTETKEFVGNVILQRLTIPDTAYVRHKYYNYTLLNGRTGDRTLTTNLASLNMHLYLDTQDVTRPAASRSAPPGTAAGTGGYSTTVQARSPYGGLLNSPTTSYSGSFTELAQGVDYTVDASSGVITLRNPIALNAVLAIDYTPPGASRSLAAQNGADSILLKYDESQITTIPQTEELTHYNIGVQNIVRDNNQGNFILQLRDLGNTPIGATYGVNYLPNNAGQIFVDFDNGFFTLTQQLNKFNNATFASVYNYSPTSASSFFLELSSRVKTYVLRPNIVINSEHISINGRPLVRDVDYFIDYQSGFITFFNQDQITQDSHIVATYDYSPFGIAGAQQDTLVGTRLELSLYPLAPILGQSLLGTSVIYDFSPQATAAPDIRQTSGSFLVNEADAHFKDLIFNPFPYLKSSFSVEGARSQRNPNTFGKALIENMEGIKDETAISMSKLTWQIAATPSQFSGGPQAYAQAIGIVHTDNETNDNLTNDEVNTLSVNPNASALPGDQTQVLDINYNLTQSAEASIATVISRSGVDFSKKQYVEMWVQGDGSAAAGTPSGTRINLTLGQISEDADGTHGGGFTDIHGFQPPGNGAPRTEDLNYNNTLDVGEDVGWTYHNPDGTTVQVGAGNLTIDSEDFDRNGILDGENPGIDGAGIGGMIGYQPSGYPGISISSISFNGASDNGNNTVDHSGWQFVRVPLNISSTTASANQWSAIKELRLSLLRGTGSPTGTIRIAKISIVGDKWQADAPPIGSTVTVKAINNEDDSSYVSPAGDPDFDALNQVNTALTGPTPNKKKEQALALDFSFDPTLAVAGSSVTAAEVTVSPMDYTEYGTVRMFVYGDGGGETFIYQAGSDTDYLEFTCPITWRGWRQLYITQVGPGAGQRPDTWAPDARNPSQSAIRVVGSPNLSNVAQQRVGVQRNAGNENAGEIWIDEIYASDVLTRIGYAVKAASDFELFGWATFGMNVTDIDRNFETFTSAITNQDRHETDAYLNLTRFTWFPMKFTGSSKRTDTPAINTVTGGSLVSVQSEGRVDDNAFAGSGTLQLPRWPKLGLSYDTDVTKTAALFRKDTTDHYGTTLDYAVPGNRAWLPRTISMGYRITKLNLEFGPDALLTATDPFSVSNTQDDTRDITAKMSFQPKTGFTFSPNYSLSTTHEDKDVIFSTGPTGVGFSTTTLAYDLAKTQTAGFDGVMSFTRWFAPRMRYSMTDRETYGIPLAADPTAASQKNVDRTATGETAWDFAWRDFSKKARPLQSLNVVSSYILEDGDSWQNVDAGYNTLPNLFVRSPLHSGDILNSTLRDTLRSTQRWNPFDWMNLSGMSQPLKTLSLASTYTETLQRQNATGTQTRTNTQIFPDLIIGLSQTEYLFGAQRFMSNSQLNLKTQIKQINTEAVSTEKASTYGGDWRFTLWRKLDLFVTYTKTSDVTNDLVNNVTSSNSQGQVIGVQAGFNLGKWRISPKYDQTNQKTVDSSGNPTTDLTTRVPAVQAYADLYLPAGLRLPFGDLVVFSNRVRTTNTLSLTQSRSSLSAVANNTDTYAFTTSNDYEVTPNVRVTVGGTYSYQINQESSDANVYIYQLNALVTIQF